MHSKITDGHKACQLLFFIFHKTQQQQQHTMQPRVFLVLRQPVPVTPDEMDNWQAVELNNS